MTAFLIATGQWIYGLLALLGAVLLAIAMSDPRHRRTATQVIVIIVCISILAGALSVVRLRVVVGEGPEPCTFWPPLGDANGDGVVDILDFSLLATHFGAVRGEPGYSAAVDFNCDGVIDDRDFGILESQWGATGPGAPPRRAPARGAVR